MSRTDKKVLREMRLHKRHAHKAVIKALKRSKSDTALTVKEMEEFNGEVEPLIKLLGDCVSEHLGLLEEKESNLE